MQNNYDSIARYYDMLSRIVYFRAQLNAQTDQLPFIPANSKILIAGGGTGWILEEISKQHPSGLNITYVEISAKMLELSRKRHVKENSITYIHAAAEDLKTNISAAKQLKTNAPAVHQMLDGPYDVIITAFLFDNFSKDKIDIVFDKFHEVLRPEGLWLFADFYYTAAKGKRWQKYLLKVMYFFFRKISNIETNTLIDTAHHFEEHAYRIRKLAYYYRGFIKSIIYQKS